jgi:rod shape determining protein RodA
LLSYGGTSMFASLLAIGLLQNIHGRSMAVADRHPAEPARLLAVR